MKSVLFISVFFFLSLLVCDLAGQDALVVSGGDSINAENSVSYSIGQVFFLTLEQSNYYVSHGIQNPLVSITINTDFAKISDSDIKIDLFPNPVIDRMQLRMCLSELSNSWFQLIDIDGNILFTNTTFAAVNSNDPGHMFIIQMHMPPI